jgi:hypothetical protein
MTLPVPRIPEPKMMPAPKSYPPPTRRRISSLADAIGINALRSALRKELARQNFVKVAVGTVRVLIGTTALDAEPPPIPFMSKRDIFTKNILIN